MPEFAHLEKRLSTSSHRPAFYEHLGLRYADDDPLSVELPATLALQNSKGAIHGGALAALIDATLSRVVRDAYPDGTKVSTIDLTIHYLEQATASIVIGRGKLLRAGRSLAVGEAVVLNGEGGTVAAHGVATFRVHLAKKS